MLFRFNIIEPTTSDFVDVQIKGPTGRVVSSWNETNSEHYQESIKENGLYSFCFRRRQNAKKKLQIYFLLDVISAGSIILRSYPDQVGTVEKTNPKQFNTMMVRVKGEESYGILSFDLHDVASGILHDNTRAVIQLFVEFSEKDDREIQILHIPTESANEPFTYDMLSSMKLSHAIDYSDCKTGSAVQLDVTEEIEDILKNGDTQVAFLLKSTNDHQDQVSLFSMTHASPEQWPQLIFEDTGIETMHEIANFKSYVFELRGEVSYILQKERLSRDAAESVNSRIKWTALMINIVLVGVALGQIFYVRNLLETGY